jgi:hypothetical protein
MFPSEAPPLIKINVLLFFKRILCLLEKIFTDGFITSSISENRFDSQLPACTNNFFYIDRQ